MKVLTLTQHQEAMQFLFGQIAPQPNWKGPVEALVPWDMANVYMQAIEYMTAVKPDCESIYVPHMGRCAKLTCVGYSKGPAGP